jgi:hypothetical protein
MLMKQGALDVITSFQNSNAHFLSFIQRSWPEIFGILLGCELLYSYFEQMAALSPHTGFQITVMLGQLLTGLLEFVFLTVLTPLRINEITTGSLNKSEFWPYALKHSHAFLIESIRALGMTLLWMLALILPGVFKYLRYCFVPYIVLADPEYEKGNVDALERSNELIRGITLILFLLFLALGLLEYGQTYLRKSFPLGDYFPVWTIIFAAGALVSVYANILLYELYLVRTKTHRGDK